MEQFQGRSKELADLSKILFENSKCKNVICLTGESGIGKTSLALELFYKADTPLYASHFDEKVKLTAYLENNWDNIITRLVRDLLGELPLKGTSSELEIRILRLIMEKKVLLFLDNIDQLDPKTVEAFVNKWSATDNGSKLILTIKESPFEGSPPTNCILYELGGITEKFVIKHLLGNELVELIDREKMWSTIKRLGNNPQKLIFLRWRAFSESKSLRRCIQDLEKVKTEMAEPVAIDTVLQKIPFPLLHFLALGQVRLPDFDEKLLAFLWDRLCGGSTDAYMQILEKLLDEKLISIENLGNRRKFRLSAGVHIGLQKPLIELIGENRVAAIDYFLSVYYRGLFADSKKTSFDLRSLESYVHHSVRSGNFKSAYSYIFESDILDIAHNRGLSLELKPILSLFNEHSSKLLKHAKKTPAVKKELAEKCAKIQIELGHVYNDLSSHELCLSCMKEADRFLEKGGESWRELKKDIYYFSAISSSDLGRSNDCMHYYSQIIRDAVAEGKFTWFDSLSMGYLAHEVKFHDIKKSEELGRKALELSENIGHKNTIIKNICSLSQTLLFMGKKDESKKLFDEALFLCERGIKDGSVDLREKGRVLIHMGAVEISLRQWEEAEEHLKEGFDLNRQFGDRRRAASAIAYHAIRLHKTGQTKKAKEKMLDVIEKHKDIHDWRNLVNEVLTYVWMSNSKFSGRRLQHFNPTKTFPKNVGSCIDHILEDNQLSIFVNFWEDHFKPQLLLA